MNLTTRGLCILGVWVCVLMLGECGGGPSTTPQPLLITTASLPNGTAWVAYSQAIQATGGSAPFTWSVSTGALPHNLSLANSGSNSVTVSGTPDTAAQAVPFTIQVTDSAGHSAKKSYTVSILLEPDTLVSSVPSVSFGLQLNGTVSPAQVFTLANNGTAPIVIVDVSTGSPDFAAASTCGSSIAAGANCTISVTFTPAVLGPSASALTITDNTAGSPHSYGMDGTGVTHGPNVTFSSGTSYNFSSAPAVPSLPQSVMLANFGDAPLHIASVNISAQFTETDNCVGTIASGSSCAINVVFTPAATGTTQGSLSVTDNAPASPQNVSLTGTGVAGMCIQKSGFCSSTQQCCAGLHCLFVGGNRPAFRCE